MPSVVPIIALTPVDKPSRPIGKVGPVGNSGNDKNYNDNKTAPGKFLRPFPLAGIRYA